MRSDVIDGDRGLLGTCSAGAYPDGSANLWKALVSMQTARTV